MQFDFDTPCDRRGTGSIKWDKYAGRDVIPMWVADMDFRSPPAVLQALRERVEHGVFGYTVAPADVIDAVVVMCAERFDWHIQRDWLLWFPGLNTALTAVCRAFGEDQDQALVLPPIYPPLLLAAPRSRKRNVLSPLVLDGQRWVMDFAHMQEVLSPRTRLLLFCNPHNPVGRVYDERELTQVAEFCERNDLLICSDDVHCDLLLDPGLRHRPLARLLPELAPRTITLMAASKTYNLAGLHCAYAIVPDAAARQRLSTVMQGVVAYISPLSYAATRAAYRDRLRAQPIVIATPGTPHYSTISGTATVRCWPQSTPVQACR